MNETTFDTLYAGLTFRERLFGTRRSRLSAAFYGYSLTLIAIGIGWLLRDQHYIDAEDGIGYWLGIVGGSMMLVLLLYPLRKRIRMLRFLGKTRHWFRIHMIFGVLGPTLVLFHSNFQLGSFNSRVALFCMLLVAGSGVVGRYIYAHIHRGLYGEKTSLEELRLQLSTSLQQTEGLTSILPNYAAKLKTLSDEVQGDSITGSMSTTSSFMWTFRKYSVWLSLRRIAHREIAARAMVSGSVKNNTEKLQKATAAYSRNFVQLVGRVAQFTLFERLFSLWHILHMPLFFMMVISALLHVLAVHMY